MNVQDNKKKFIILGAGIVSFIVIIAFAFLFMKQDKLASTQSSQNGKENVETNISTKSQQENLEDNEVSLVYKEAPYTKIVVNGKEASVQSGDLLISPNGELYLKTNVISDNGISVGWQKDTVWIGDQPMETTSGTVLGETLVNKEYLRFYRLDNDNDLDRYTKIYQTTWDEQKAFQIAGEHFNSGIGMYISNSWSTEYKHAIDYNLAGEYKTFEALVGVDDIDKDFSTNFKFFLYGDDRLLTETQYFRGGDFAVPVSADVEGVLRLSLVVEAKKDGENKYHHIVIANPILKK